MVKLCLNCGYEVKESNKDNNDYGYCDHCENDMELIYGEEFYSLEWLLEIFKKHKRTEQDKINYIKLTLNDTRHSKEQKLNFIDKIVNN